MKDTFAAAGLGKQSGRLIFDIGGNKYRLIASVDFAEQLLVIEEILTPCGLRKGDVLMTGYEILLCETRPEAIATGKQYDAVVARLAELVRKGGSRTKDEARLMRLLAVLVEDYDRRHALPPGRVRQTNGSSSSWNRLAGYRGSA